MIGWKCDYGYIKYADYKYGKTINLDKIVYTDNGKAFTIGTKIDGQYDTNRHDFKNAFELAENALSIIGNDYFTMYGVPQPSYWLTLPSSIRLFIEEATPSYMAMAPNLWSYYGDDSKVEVVPLVRIPLLNRILVAGGYYIYDLDGNLIADGLADYFNYRDNNSRWNYLFCFKYDGTISSLRIESNWVLVQFTQNYKSYKFSTPPISRFITAMFGDNYKDPDWDGGGGGDGPYEPGGPSGPGDLPPGTFDDTSDPIPDSPLPTISAADTGFTRIYNPTLSQVQELARYLWTEPSILDTIWNHIKQFFEDPMQAIIGFNLVPCKVPDGGTRSFALMFIDTGVQMTSAANQFVDVDCGTFKLERYYGSALDQNPYTKVSCFLPYIGTVHLNTDEVMGTTLQVKYRIDIVSGSCVAKILVDGSVLYQYSGHCAITIPISAADFSSYVSAAIAVGTAAAGMAVGAAAGAAVPTGSMIAPTLPVSAGAIGGPTELATISPPTDFQLNVATFTHNMNVSQSQAKSADFAGLAESAVLNSAGQTMGSKMQIEHSGSFSGNSGYLGVRRPFLIIERPNMCLPETYGRLNGYPSMITLNLGECKGFTRVQQVQLTGCTATNPEQSEILQFLKSGVIL